MTSVIDYCQSVRERAPRAAHPPPVAPATRRRCEGASCAAAARPHTRHLHTSGSGSRHLRHTRHPAHGPIFCRSPGPRPQAPGPRNRTGAPGGLQPEPRVPHCHTVFALPDSARYRWTCGESSRASGCTSTRSPERRWSRSTSTSASSTRAHGGSRLYSSPRPPATCSCCVTAEPRRRAGLGGRLRSRALHPLATCDRAVRLNDRAKNSEH